MILDIPINESLLGWDILFCRSNDIFVSKFICYIIHIMFN